MVEVPEGTFSMGCEPDLDAECTDSVSAQPYHEVYLDGFCVDIHETTVADYRSCVDDGGCTEPDDSEPQCNFGADGRDDHPVNCITWAQGDAYCTWAGKRLLTEAEWEKAARGDDGRLYPWGNEGPSCDLAVIEDDNGEGCGEGTTSPVGSKPLGASPYGAMDMAGNVLEVVADYYSEDYYDVSPFENPTGPDSGEWRVARSSAWDSSQPSSSRTWKRWVYALEAVMDTAGVRCGGSL
jgi:formylglycine-generating enzyme required for sulfatase activity